MANWSMNFTSVKGNEYTVTILGMSESKALVPADTPLTTSPSTSEDPFEPVRGGTGYIRVIGNITEFDELFLSTPLAHKVRVYRYDDDLDANILEWSGFIKCEAYTLSNTATKQVIEIPLIDTLSVLSDIKMPSTWSWAPTALGTILKRIITLSGGDITDVILPHDTLYSTILKHTIRPQNWVEVVEDPDINGSYYRYKTLADIMKDIAIAYGWSIQQDGTFWVMAASDRSIHYDRIPVEDLEEDNPRHPAGGSQVIEEQWLRDELIGQSKISMRQGIASVTVENSPGDPVKDLFRLDLDKFVFVGRSKGVISTGNHPSLVGYYFGEDAPMLACENSTNKGPLMAKFDAYRVGTIAETDEYNIGSGLEELIWKADGVDEEKHVGITFSPAANGQSHGDWFTTITPRWKINTTESNVYLDISGMLKMVYHWADGFVAPTGNKLLVVQLRVGDKWLAQGQEWRDTPLSNYLVCDANTGKISRWIVQDEYTIDYPLTDYAAGALLLLPSGAYGDISLKIKLPVSGGEVGSILESFQMSLFYTYPLNAANLDGKANKYIKLIGDNRNDYKIGGNLTIAQGNQHGAGCITSEPYDIQVPEPGPDDLIPWSPQYEYRNLTSLDSTGKRPEVLLGERITAQLSTPYRFMRLDLTERYFAQDRFIIGGNTYTPMGVGKDWQKERYNYSLMQIKV